MSAPVLLSACSSLPTTWFGDDVPNAADIAPTENYPNLADVPERPKMPKEALVEQRREALEEDREEGAVLATEEQNKMAVAQSGGDTTPGVMETPVEEAPLDEAATIETKEESVTLHGVDPRTLQAAPQVQQPAPAPQPATTASNVIAVGLSYRLSGNGEGGYALRDPSVSGGKNALATAVYFPEGNDDLTLSQYNNLKRIAAKSVALRTKLQVTGYLPQPVPASVAFDDLAAQRTLKTAAYLIDFGVLPADITVRIAPLSEAPDASAVAPASTGLRPSRVDLLFVRTK